MLELFKSTGLGQKQRFYKALVCGFLASIVLLLVYLLLIKMMYSVGWDFAIAYLGIGYAIGWVIQKTGHGTKVSFSIMAAVYCTLIIFFGDLFAFIPWQYAFANFFESIKIILGFYLTADISTMISLAFRALAIYTAFRTARVV